MESVFKRAKTCDKHIVLAEGEELRIINAAKEIVKRDIARITLIGDAKIIESKAGKLKNINIINPHTCEKTADYINLLYETRKAKGLTLEQAERLALNPLYFATLMLKNGDADGMVAGSINSTGDVMRPALQIIKTKPGVNTVSSCFVMCMPEDRPGFGQNGVLVFGDCAVMPNPNAQQLADIAIASADSGVKIAGIDPKVALLSFSTKGSAKHELVDKVVEATKILKEKAPHLVCDGELQADAALDAAVGRLKAPNSCVAGQANVLIFPDLQAGNIGYKLVQRIANAEAVGPICQGMAKPVNDLSRGCSVEDIIGVVDITALQCD
ncbi:MAG: phosphate acetyltransferase [Clostridiales bacterium]|nr:phosphate acetyltransferase [Clostridiales bacterium]